jgi:phosphatidylinositol glycan class T
MRSNSWQPWQGTLLLLAAASLLFMSAVCASEDRFDEHLTLRPLADGRLHTQFAFTLTSAPLGDVGSTPIYTTVPRTLIHLARASDAEEIHLAINAGRWDYEKWGRPVEEEMVGTGAEVWAKLRNDSQEAQNPE